MWDKADRYKEEFKVWIIYTGEFWDLDRFKPIGYQNRLLF